VFGGLSSALALSLARRDLEEDWAPRSASIQFARPLAPGRVVASRQELRRGKSTRFFRVELFDHDGESALVASLVFGRARNEAMRVAGPTWTDAPDPETLQDLPYIEGVTPEFTKHVAFRWVDGAFPYSGADQAKFRAYARFRAPAGGPEGLLALLDVWPCPSLSVLSKPAAASTVQWTAHFVDVPERLESWLAYEYETVAGEGGFHSARGQLFAPDGRLLALSEQLVAVFG